jgi:hypothetical protein
MSSAKLHINLVQGTLDVEGDVEFVREVYKDYREGLIAKPTNAFVQAGEDDEIGTGNASTSSAGAPQKDSEGVRRKRKAPRQQKDGATAAPVFKPALVNDLATTDLKSYMADFDPKSNYDYIALFMSYLEGKNISPVTFNHVYTCFRDAQVKAPVALRQAFIDTRNKKGFVEFTSPFDVSLTERGRNHVQFGELKKRAAEPA